MKTTMLSMQKLCFFVCLFFRVNELSDRIDETQKRKFWNMKMIRKLSFARQDEKEVEEERNDVQSPNNENPTAVEEITQINRPTEQ